MQVNRKTVDKFGKCDHVNDSGWTEESLQGRAVLLSAIMQTTRARLRSPCREGQSSKARLGGGLKFPVFFYSLIS